jgi:COX assembly protein 1
MTEERMDSMKLDYIANRSEKGKQAVLALREQRTSHLRKHYGKKDTETVPTS